MERDFWLKKWSTNEIGFHQQEIHPLLETHWPALGVPPGARVLVPLCGKSNDMDWLARRGLEVIGFELSEVAVDTFFAARACVPARDAHGAFRRYRARLGGGGITIFCGDFFAATPELCAPCAALYDRAALIALAAAQRAAYLATVRALLTPSARGLLITVEYPAGAVSPPPFSLEADEVAEHYGPAWQLEPCARQASDIKGYAGTEAAYLLAVRAGAGS